MGLLSLLFSGDREGRIHVLKSTIESHKQSISVERNNMARYRAQKAPKHYQDAGKRKIEYHKQIIEKLRAEIANLKKR
ncbi:MAG: hypothetical protein HYR66_16570 [Sphingobacteriales bacterium]|nr:hypothetical protein [Sphingobacteriales bacterium]MBI3717896.1 hypothetical protein [Sphingobacteriales bacterium]